MVVFFDADDAPDPRALLADWIAPVREAVFEVGVCFDTDPRALPLPPVVDLPVADPPDRVDACAAVPLRAAVFPVAGREAAVRLAVDALVEPRPVDLDADLPADPATDLPAALTGADRPALPRVEAVLLADVRVEGVRVEAPFAGARFVTTVFVDAVLAAAPLLDAVLAAAALFNALPFAADFDGVRVVDVFAEVDLPAAPAVAVLPVVLLVEAFLAAGLLAPVFLAADLRGLVVAMHLSRGLVAPPWRPSFDNTRCMQAR